MTAGPRYGGFWRRLAATLLDAFIYGCLSFLAIYPLYGPDFFKGTGGGWVYGLTNALLNWLLPFLLSVFCWVRLRGTPGKLLMTCQVVDAASLETVTAKQAALRYVGYLASILPAGLGFLWIIWDRRKQGFHDKIAGTVVVLEDPSRLTLADLEKELQR
ncbi:MAG: RDD family protein [Pseudomonadota bacterium]|nr:RDD family protein [Pseudomonadota bacterium]